MSSDHPVHRLPASSWSGLFSEVSSFLLARSTAGTQRGHGVGGIFPFCSSFVLWSLRWLHGISRVCLFVGCLMSQQHASVSQGWICSDNFTCCHTEIEVADQTFYLTQSQYTDTGPTSPSADPTTPGTWQGSHWSANFWVTGMTWPRKNPGASGIRTQDFPLSRRTPDH